MNLTNDIIEYREPGDDEKVVRFNSKKPDGYNYRLKSNVPVNGITFRVDESMDRQTIVLSIWPQGVQELGFGPKRYTGRGGPIRY